MSENERVEHTPERPLRVAILISGRGSNMQALVDVVAAERLPVRICAVLSNRADAAGLDWARDRGLPAEALSHRDFVSRDAFDAALLERLDALAPDYILLAGFMRVLGSDFVRHFNGRIINIHPSLLPSFPGLHTHQQALAQGVQWHGCTVHFVTPVLDHGPIIAQGIIPVLENDTSDSLASRLLPVEHQLYMQVLRWLAQGRVALRDDGRVRVDGVTHRAWSGVAAFNSQDSHEHE
ncbi:MAG: phosphoribosylglycinamide formyltransferase [Castellaniella sp.]|nr:phosphoribosylglycinamide formyltransferase [Castellaniella sp.]